MNTLMKAAKAIFEVSARPISDLSCDSGISEKDLQDYFYNDVECTLTDFTKLCKGLHVRLSDIVSLNDSDIRHMYVNIMSYIKKMDDETIAYLTTIVRNISDLKDNPEWKNIYVNM